MPLLRLVIRVTHLKLLAGELAVNEKHFFFTGYLFGQLGGKEGLPGVGTCKEDSVLSLDNEAVSILLRHRCVLRFFYPGIRAADGEKA